jgi:hypothetical protein
VNLPNADERRDGESLSRLHHVVYAVLGMLERDEIPDLDRERNVRDAEIVAGEIVEPYRNSEHAGMIASP